ncbi:MAG: nucleoside kinase [Clostridiales bacterium]|nr:nucleoside kinase [Clostridiales bacterium]
MLKYKDRSFEINEGDSWKDVCERNGLRDVLAVCVGGRPEGLASPATGEAQALTYADEEGRRIYERSLCFVLLCAINRLMPGTRVRMENSYGMGVLVTVRDARLGDSAIKKLEAEMKRICAEALPFSLTEVSRDDAIAYFNSVGQTDKADLLSWRQKPTFRLYECDGIKDYFYGEMVYDTSYVSVFALSPMPKGFVLRLPSPDSPERPAPVSDTKKLLETYTESNSWIKILGVENASDLNRMTRNGELREFIRVNEALVDMKINQIAERIIDRKARLVLIAGPSSSGKTTFCNRLAIALRVHGVKPVKLSLDDYYLNREDVPLDEEGKPDLECLEALDVPLINRQLKQILEGEEVDMPTFDFVTQKRSSTTHKVRVGLDQPVLIEGIHGLNDKLTLSIPDDEKFRIYISSLINLNLDDHNRIRSTDARLIRRLARDSAFRGTPVENTLAMWGSVRRGEDRFIFPFQERADMMINSSLVYELAILKKYIFDELCAVTPDKPFYAQARRLVKFLNYIQSSDAEDEIPLNSLLREFIGGSCFYR